MYTEKEPLSIRSLSKRKHYLLALLGILISIVLAAWAVKQVMQTWSINEEAVKVEEKTEEVRQKAAEAQAILSSTEYLKSQEIVDKALPDKKPFLELLSNLDRVGKATSVVITDISLSPGSLASGSASSRTGSGDSNSEHIDLTFKVTSTFDAFLEFMQTMEKVVPFTSVMKFSIADENRDATTEQTVDASEQLISVTIDTYTYFYATQPNQVEVIKPLDPKEAEILTEIERLQAVDLPEQTEIIGGGLEDLFGVAGYKEIIQGF